ncbi:MAG: biopolymer transporter ExbD [Azoarcus sp.]|jgi:biopolymer transport protein ExbD|nr:biopolymer transporter ExbD [Azoarcus sp.]
MNFRRSGSQNEPEINLVPLIDVMLVIIIFLMLTTSFNKVAGLDIALPTAAASGGPAVSEEIVVAVTPAGDIYINKRPVGDKSIATIAAVLANIRPPSGPEPVVVINADAQATHQNVINVMQAAQQAGLARVTFAIQQETGR